MTDSTPELEPVEAPDASDPRNGASFGTLDDLPASADVASRRPRAAVTIIALLVAALLAVVVVVFGVGTIAHVLEVGGDSTLGLPTVEQNTGIDFPDGSEVLAATSTDDAFTAEVALPGGTLPDFALAGYGAIAESSDALESAVGAEPVRQYYRAASNSLVGSAALVDRDGSLVVFVDVRAVG